MNTLEMLKRLAKNQKLNSVNYSFLMFLGNCPHYHMNYAVYTNLNLKTLILIESYTPHGFLFCVALKKIKFLIRLALDFLDALKSLYNST